MGSNCIIRGCRNRPTNKGTSFHRLKFRLRNSGCSLDSVFGPGSSRPITDTSRICTEHFLCLPIAVQNSTSPSLPCLNFADATPRREDTPPSPHGPQEDDHLGLQLFVNLIKFKHFFSSLAFQSTMIADPVPDSGPDNAIASSSVDMKTVEAVKEEEGEENNRSVPERTTATVKSSNSPVPTNGSVDPEEEQRLLPPPVQLLHPPPPYPTEPGPKEDDEAHMSSEDEDKLVINETCEKKEVQQPRQEDRTTLGAPLGKQTPTALLEGLQEPSPNSPLKRSVEDADAPVPSKKSRVVEESEESPPLSMTQLDESIALLKSDLQALELLMLQKEEEWNSILRLSKKKEELYYRLLRKRQVMKIRAGKEYDAEDEVEDDGNVVFLPQGAYSSLGTAQFPAMMLKHMLGDSYVPQVVSSSSNKGSCGGREGASTNGPVASPGNVSVIDIHTSHPRSTGAANCGGVPAGDVPQISISPDTHSKLGKQLSSIMSMKPILPKPPSSGVMVNAEGGSLPPLSYPTTGYGPQGPTVSVQHLIAAHRKDNPNIPPISDEVIWSASDMCSPRGRLRFRGTKRGALKPRYEGNEKRSSSREPDRPSSVSSSSSETDVRINASKGTSTLHSSSVSASASSSSSLLTTDPSVSYKDVLLQFAQLTQSEKQPGSPQISIIPVSGGDSSMRKSDLYTDSSSISRESPISSQNSSQSQALEGSSALAKLLLESGASNHGHASKPPAVDLSFNSNSNHNLTLSALLSGGTTTTIKEKNPTGAQMDSRPKKTSSNEETNSNPKCQGCHKYRAQFVCAGCGNQWYCSRPCQVNAWEKHSEHCNS